MKIAVLGAGISGLGAAYLLSQKHEVDLYEKEGRLGGHARTTQVEENGNKFGVDTGFLVFNRPTYPLLTKLFERLHVKIENSDMSFGFWDEKSDIAYNGDSVLGMFLQKRNLFRPSHLRMIKDILAFNKQASKDIEEGSDRLNLNLGEYIKHYGDAFKERYLLPMGAAIWSTPTKEMHDFPAKTFLHFFKNHGLLGVDTHHQWLTVSGGSVQYVNKIKEQISGKIILNSTVKRITRDKDGVWLHAKNGEKKHYDKVILAMHAPAALGMLEDATENEKEILSAFGYKTNTALLHQDTSALYPSKKMYASWNYRKSIDTRDVTLSYWINRLQNLKSKREYFVSLNETKKLNDVIEEIEYEHPQFDERAITMQERREEINGTNHTYFAGAYWRYGFHEDGLWSANTIAKEFGCAL